MKKATTIVSLLAMVSFPCLASECGSSLSEDVSQSRYKESLYKDGVKSLFSKGVEIFENPAILTQAYIDELMEKLSAKLAFSVFSDNLILMRSFDYYYDDNPVVKGRISEIERVDASQAVEEKLGITLRPLMNTAIALLEDFNTQSLSVPLHDKSLNQKFLQLASVRLAYSNGLDLNQKNDEFHKDDHSVVWVVNLFGEGTEYIDESLEIHLLKKLEAGSGIVFFGREFEHLHYKYYSDDRNPAPSQTPLLVHRAPSGNRQRLSLVITARWMGDYGFFHSYLKPERAFPGTLLKIVDRFSPRAFTER